MKLKPYFLLLFVTLAFGTLHSQTTKETSSKAITFKIYGNFLYLNSDYQPRWLDFEEETFEFLALTPALSFQNKNSRIVHEFEGMIRLNSPSSDNSDIELGLRYERGKYLRKELLKNLRFRWGFAARAFYYFGERVPATSVDFPVERRIIGLELSLTGQLEYAIGNRLTLHLSTNNIAIQTYWDYFRVFNPVLTVRQQRSSSLDFNLGGQRILRLGLGYRFGS